MEDMRGDIGRRSPAAKLGLEIRSRLSSCVNKVNGLAWGRPMPKLAQLPANDRAPDTADANARRVPRLQPRYFAFLSYSHKDKALADWLHHELERFRVPRALAGRLTANGIVPRRLTPIFRDEHDLAAAGDLGGEIKAALAVSQYLIVLCSPTWSSAKRRGGTGGWVTLPPHRSREWR